MDSRPGVPVRGCIRCKYTECYAIVIIDLNYRLIVLLIMLYFIFYFQ